MKSHAFSYFLPALPIKASLAMALLIGMMPAQAAPSGQPDSAASVPDTDKVIVSNDPVKPARKSRKISRAPAKPETYPTKPQQAVRSLR